MLFCTVIYWFEEWSRLPWGFFILLIKKTLFDNTLIYYFRVYKTVCNFNSLVFWLPQSLWTGVMEMHESPLQKFFWYRFIPRSSYLSVRRWWLLFCFCLIKIFLQLLLNCFTFNKTFNLGAMRPKLILRWD